MTGSSPASVARRRRTATSRDARAPADAPIWSVPPWPRRRASPAISSTCARRNFGCGSSREHAPWALGDYGFRAIIAPSFADIFFNNCFKNGLLPIVLPEADVERLFHDTAAFPGFKLTIDLERQTVATTD